MRIILHQTHQTLCDFEAIFDYIRSALKSSDDALHIFPENFLCGYPIQDLCLQRSFVISYLEHLDKISKWASSALTGKHNLHALMGGLSYEVGPDHLPQRIEAAIFHLRPGTELKKVYAKRLLPNYDIFDERKYFTPGKKQTVLDLGGTHAALMICEDMWTNASYDIDPVTELKKSGEKIDFVINISASPWHLGKHEKRAARALEIANVLKTPFIYVNRVGGEDEILFDGQSFVHDGNKITAMGKFLQEDVLDTTVPAFVPASKNNVNAPPQSAWEDLFAPRLDFPEGGIPSLKNWTDKECEEVLFALGFGLQEYATKCGFSRFLVALSGGMDSSLVLAIIRHCLRSGQRVEAIYMPGLYSAPLSSDMATKLCANLKVPLHVLPIKFIHSACRNQIRDCMETNIEGLADENIQSRLRSVLLYAVANQQNSLVINTSNKSEIAVGYSTQYGDSVGGIGLLGDLYKTEVYHLAGYLDKIRPGLIPQDIIMRPPSAELRANQKDTDSLPPYRTLDAILEGMLSFRLSASELIESGFLEKDVRKVFLLHQNSEFKRKQFCPIIKIKAKSFGFGHRVPVAKNNAFYKA
jgi:NAD+ synthase (glutamine-hydrolysing)